eukprot:GHUV01026953.1.p3 GENE.GHUV01026953.1~~GHUV01026953.1.p3  ORF type:complete len:113 (-),score=25.53 GHUV01026953.1:573-911(-)
MEDSPEVQQQHQQLEEDRLDDETQDADDQAAYNESSEDEEFNQKNFGIYQALPVEGEPDWSLGELASSTGPMLASERHGSFAWSSVECEPCFGSLHCRGTRQRRRILEACTV